MTPEERNTLIELAKTAQAEHQLEGSPYFYLRNRYNLLMTERAAPLLRLVAHAKGALQTLLQRPISSRPSQLPEPQFMFTMWAMVQRDGDFVLSHHHIGSHWTCVFYIKCDPTRAGSHPHSGWLILSDPRSRNRDDSLNFPPHLHMVQPEPGLMVLFPGYINHEVPTYLSDGERIAYVLNINVHVSETHEQMLSEVDLLSV
jgi:hypothetical protein